ncbi:uracil-DNA glycosylase, partial [Staphylococcus epidermidis]
PKFPPSLRNMYQQLQNHIRSHTTSPHLQHSATQRVLLLNTLFTLPQPQPHSHPNIPSQTFTHQIIQPLSNYPHHLLFILSPRPPQQNEPFIHTSKHLI